MKKEVCKGKVYDKRYPYPSHACRNKAWKDGYCQLHHPDERGRRRKQNEIEREKLYNEAQERKKIISSNLLVIGSALCPTCLQPIEQNYLKCKNKIHEIYKAHFL